MKTIPRKEEAKRLAVLHGLGILDTAPERPFERIVRLTARTFGMPMAAITLVDEYRVWNKATYGLARRERAREESFCAHAILEKSVLVVRDALEDTRFGNRVGLPDARPVRFYAGAPLRTAEGHVLGALCVSDTVPRDFTRRERTMLTDLAAVVIDELALRQAAGRLSTESAGRQRSHRTLVRQHRLLRRLSGSLEDGVRQRTADLERANSSLRAEIVRRERADAALLRAKEEAEQANSAKSEFLSRMSHELRTPLNAILGFGQILQGVADNTEARRDCAGHVVNAGRHLLGLINEVLDIARIEAGHMDLSLEPVRVPEIVGEALDLIRPQAAVRGISVEVVPGLDAAGPVLADRQKLRQVVLNLVSNAVKYSPEGGPVVIQGRVERTRTLRLCVSDAGPGIARDKAERLFVAFDRLGAEHSEVPGTGLGLALSKRLTEAMGGKIGVRTAPGKGSEFWVRLPLSRAGILPMAPDADSPADPAELMPNPALHAACTILYIEDNPSNLRLVEHVLASCPDVRLLSARRGEDGLALARSQRPDLILLDLHLPDLPGWDVLARLRGEKATRRIPVVAVSADAAAGTVARLMQAGAQAYLTKPLNVGSLYRLLPEVTRPAGPRLSLPP